MDRRARLGMILMLFAGYTLIYIDKTVMGFALLPIRAEFNFTPQQVGLIPGLFFFSYTLFQIPAGWLNDRLGYRAMLVMSLALVGVCALLFGWWGLGLGWLILFRMLAGIGHSGYPSASAKTVTMTFDLQHRTFVQSLLLSSSGMAMVIGPLLAIWALRVMRWQQMYMVFAALFLLVALLMLVLLPKHGQQHQEVAAPSQGSWRLMFRHPLIWQLIIANVCVNLPAYSLMAWLPSFLVKEHGLSMAVTGEIISIGGIGAWASSIIGGWLVGRYGSGREPLVILCTALVAACGLLGIYFSTSLLATIVILMITNGATFCTFVFTFTLPLKRFEPRIMGTTVGFLNACGVAGGFIGPIVIGYLVAASGGDYFTSFLFMMVAIVIAGLALLPGSRRPLISPQHQESL